MMKQKEGIKNIEDRASDFINKNLKPKQEEIQEPIKNESEEITDDEYTKIQKIIDDQELKIDTLKEENINLKVRMYIINQCIKDYVERKKE